MLPRRILLPILGLALGSLACGSSTDYGSGGGGGGNPPTGDVLIVSGASTKGANAYNPNPFTVALNGAPSVDVKWANTDNTTPTHTVTQNGATPAFNHSLAAGSTFTFSFTTAGTYDYHCTIHPGMNGSIVVNP